MSKEDFIERLKARTKMFALSIIKFYQELPKTGEGQILGKQLLRSATSVAANYRAVCRARSKAEFFSKISIVVEEADETQFWLELLMESGIADKERTNILHSEATEIVKIVATARKNISRNK